MSSPDSPQPGEFWVTAKGRTAEIVARDTVRQQEFWELDEAEVDTIAYRFLGGSMIRLRSVGSLKLWTKVEFE